MRDGRSGAEFPEQALVCNADKCSSRRADSFDGSDARGNFLNVYSWVQRFGHKTPPVAANALDGNLVERSVVVTLIRQVYLSDHKIMRRRTRESKEKFVKISL